jgi:DNA-3-methyladenine glycosylase
MKKLDRGFFNRNTLKVARELLGKFIVRQCGKKKNTGKIVETEAYMGPLDLASHASKGKTPRTEIMFGKPGIAYIYLIYLVETVFL